MRILAVLLAIVATSSAASIMAIDDKELEKVMMQHITSQGNMIPMMDILALMDAQQQPQEPEAVVAEGDDEAAHDGAEEPRDDKKEVQAVEVEDPQPEPNMFDNGIMDASFPEMMTGAIPHAARKPSKKPTGTASNGNRKPTIGNGKRGGTSAAAASANSFSRGPNSFASSQAQAFSRGFK